MVNVGKLFTIHESYGVSQTQGTLLHCRPFHLDNHAEDVCILKVSGFVDDFCSADVHPKLFGFKPDVVEQTYAQTSNLDHFLKDPCEHKKIVETTT